MSVNHYVYIGSMVEVKPCKVTVKEKVIGCKACNIEALSSQKFCSECGKPVKQYERTSKEDFDIWEISDDISDKYNIEEVNDKTYIIDAGTKYGLFIDEEVEGCIDLKLPEKAPVDYFSDVTKTLAKAGCSFKIKHGVLAYWN